jgi:hypothetical protein
VKVLNRKYASAAEVAEDVRSIAAALELLVVEGDGVEIEARR